MTEITIYIPDRLEITEGQTIERNRIPLIPSTQIIGQLLPDQIPLGVIPGLENFEQLDTAVESLSNRVQAIEANDYLTGPELDEQLDDFTEQFNAFTETISSKAPQTGLLALAEVVAQANTAIANLVTALGQKADSAHTHPISEIQGLSDALSALQNQIDLLGTLDSDLAAIAALQTTGFGRSLLTVADAAAARTALQIPDPGQGGGAQPTIAQLVYTATQSSRNADSDTWRGTYANLTNGLFNDGAATRSESGQTQWIKADLGAVKTVARVTVAGGSISGLTGIGALFSVTRLEASTNDLDWTTLLTFGAITEGTRAHDFPISVTARYLRLARTTIAGATEFRLFGY